MIIIWNIYYEKYYNFYNDLYSDDTLISYTIATKQDGWTIFNTIPFFRADLYNITLISQNIIGTNIVGTFTSKRFIINKTKYGINILSNDMDVNSWFHANTAYEFKYSFTKIINSN